MKDREIRKEVRGLALILGVEIKQGESWQSIMDSMRVKAQAVMHNAKANENELKQYSEKYGELPRTNKK